ncbi:hypothetical protein QN277_027713 [Acacia crassicarpa]|uniref:Uncharacterized protein n=1 Tax=Acacia crassicarpa TaxID=499986 RepID=A0AAE1J389_9FABA|nr:hypothetical protein QN277_027713 [Acacia crassicarpa]
MASSLSLLPSIISQPHGVLRLKLHTRCCFSLGILCQKPHAPPFSRTYRNQASCSSPRHVERDSTFKLTRNFSHSNTPLVDKSEGPNLHHFIAKATLAASEAQPW